MAYQMRANAVLVLGLWASAAASDAHAQFAGFDSPTAFNDLTLEVQIDNVHVDLDLDGDLDIVATQNTPSVLDTVKVWLNQGNGTFTGGTISTVGSIPLRIAAGRLDNDPFPDVVVNNRDSEDISILISNGDGTLQPEVVYLTIGGFNQDIVIDDFNRDGKGDIAALSFDINAVTIYLGDGSGTNFPSTPPYLTSNNTGTQGLGPRGLVSVDLNLDGAPDLVTSNTGDNTISVLYNDGTGVFIAGDAAQFFSTGTAPIDIVAGDWNNDGYPDLAVANALDDTVEIFLNLTTGTYPALASLTTVPTGDQPIGLGVGDIDKDGDTDIIAMNELDATYTVILVDPGAISFTPTTTPTPYSLPQVPRVGDLDGDGDDDFSSSNINNDSFAVYLNLEGTLRTSCEGDLNNDGVVNGADLGLLLGGWGVCPP
ncbi:MAG: FG-GAP repeat domain-containing protein [Phycisphaerales bacterium JB043]